MKYTEIITDKDRKLNGWSRHDARLIAEQKLRERIEAAGLKDAYERILSRYDLEAGEVVAFVNGWRIKPKLIHGGKQKESDD